MKTLVTRPGPGDGQRFYHCHAGRSARSNKVRVASRQAAPQHGSAWTPTTLRSAQVAPMRGC